MATFHLKVLTVDKQFFDGEVDRIVVRTSQGDGRHPAEPCAVCCGARRRRSDHHPERRTPCSRRFRAVLWMFRQSRRSCWRVPASGPTKSTWPCREAADRAKAILQKKAGDREMDIAQGKLKKAVNRIRIAESK